jgi:hypothetical protein
MERTQLFDLMGELKLYGMKASFDEIMATAVKRQHEPQFQCLRHILGFHRRAQLPRVSDNLCTIDPWSVVVSGS